METIKPNNIAELETHCFILDNKKFERSINGFKLALNKYCFSNIIGYSVKTNSLPYCLCLARQLGCYAEVVSHDEYELALLCGYSKDHIIYNGPMKSKNTFLDAIKNGAIVNIETKREIEWLKELPNENCYQIGIRINVNISKISPSDAINDNDYGRFGFSDETFDLMKAIENIKQLHNVKITGLHLHRSPSTRSVEFYQNLINYAAKIISKYNLNLDYLDIGGGYFGIFKDKPTYEDYCKAMMFTLSQYSLNELKIIVEPGMALIGSSFSFATKVIDTKEISNNFYIQTTDGSRNDIDPLFKKSDYIKELIYINKSQNIAKKQVITGCSCIEFDKIFSITNEHLLSVGDIIEYKNVGAYTMCLSPLFIRYFPNIYLYKNDEYSLIRDRWTAKEYIQKSKLL